MGWRFHHAAQRDSREIKVFLMKQRRYKTAQKDIQVNSPSSFRRKNRKPRAIVRRASLHQRGTSPAILGPKSSLDQGDFLLSGRSIQTEVAAESRKRQGEKEHLSVCVFLFIFFQIAAALYCSRRPDQWLHLPLAGSLSINSKQLTTFYKHEHWFVQ